MADLSLPVHHNPPAIRGSVLAPKLNWLGGLTGASKGLGGGYSGRTGDRRGQGRGPFRFSVCPKELFHSLESMQKAFLDPEGYLMADLSLPVHHNPPAIRGSVLAPKLNWVRASGGVSTGI